MRLGLVVVAVASLLGGSAWAAPKTFEDEAYAFTIPEGYELMGPDSIGLPDPERRLVALQAVAPRRGVRPTITFQRAPAPGGSLGDATRCQQGAAALARRAKSTLSSATIVAGPAGKTCQLRLVGPDGAAIITELMRPDPKRAPAALEQSLMTCNHADGDVAAEKVCRATLASFRFTRAAVPALP